MSKIVFDGQIYSGRAAGMYRYADEILKEFDKLIKKDEYSIIIPKYVDIDGKFSNIRVIRYGNVKGVIWSQTSLAKYLLINHVRCLGFYNTTPLVKPGVTIIYDIGYKVSNTYHGLYGWLSSLWHRLNYWVVSRSGRQIITISEFSKQQIQDVYGAAPERIHVIGSGWQHFESIPDDETVFDLFPRVKKGAYYFSIGSLEERKNFKWVIEAARNNPKSTFLIAGGSVKNSNRKLDFDRIKNVKLLGYVDDCAVKVLMKNCKAFIYPSTFEGFGLPPMEALSVGAPIIISDIPPHREVYGGAAHYIDPYNYDVDLDALLSQPVGPRERVLDRYSWEKSAKELLEIMREYK